MHQPLTIDVSPDAGSIRGFLPADFDAVVSLLHEAGLGHAPNDPEHDLERILQAGESRVFVYEGAGVLRGCIVAAHEGRRGWIYYLAVAPSHRGRRVGEQLMRHAEVWLRERGAPKVLLLVRDDNLQVQPFYERLGYAVEACTCLGRWLDPA